MCPYVVGQQVACIHDGPWKGGWETDRCPVYGGIYTIREVVPHLDTIGLTFEEIVNIPCPLGHIECIFQWDNFKPIKKTDISIFKKLLSPTPKQRVKEVA